MRPAHKGMTVLHATLAALQARLDLVFPSQNFVQVVLPPKITPVAWKELTRRTPMIGLGWDSIDPMKPASRLLSGVSRWSVFVVVRNQRGPEPRLLGDRLGPGLFDLVQAAAGVLHGHTIDQVGTCFVTGVHNAIGADWDMEDLVLACLTVEVGATLPNASELVEEPAGILKSLGVSWTFPAFPAGDALQDTPMPFGGRNPRPPLGAIRFDADYEPGSALSAANLAALQPPQFQHRAPFWASVDESGVLTINADTAVLPTGGVGAQAVMDAEIAAVRRAGTAIDFWAFLAHSPGLDGSRALQLYLASERRGQINFCLIADMADLWWNGEGALPALGIYAGYTAQPGYQALPDGRKLFFVLDSGAADVAARYGGNAGLFPAMQVLRAAIQSASGCGACLVLMCPDLTRAAALLDAGAFDAISAYAVPPSVSAPTPYAVLTQSLHAWWDAAADLGVPVVPPLMTNFDPSPRAVTPDAAMWGGESSLSPDAYFVAGTPAEIAAHFGDGRAWLAQQPQQIALIAYAWNEDTENNACLWPTYVAGQPWGDTSRLDALRQHDKETA